MSYRIRKIKEMTKSFDVSIEWAIERRKACLEGEIEYYREHQQRMVKSISSANAETRAFIFSSIADSKNSINRLQQQLKTLSLSIVPDKAGSITEDMIEVAREYPIESLIEVKRNMALCPFHDDHNPSMSIKNNHFHCFACGAKGDSIEFVMKRDGLSFRETIRRLI